MGKKNIIVLSAASLIVFLDQLTKLTVRNSLQLNESIPLIKNAFHLTFITNTGSAFGLFKGFNIFFVLFSIIVITAIFYYTAKIREKEKGLQFALGLLLGGTIGNLIDRLAYGHVIDFIDLRVWPVFNIADSAVTIAVGFLIVMLWRK